MRNNALPRWLAPGCTAVLMALTPGCVGYRLGTTLPADIRTVYVPIFVNRCGEPEVETDTTRAARQEFQKDGTLRIVDDEKAADVRLTTTLTSYRLEAVRFRKDDPKTTGEYRLLIVADIEAVQTRTGQVLTKRRVQGENTFPFTGDLSSAKAAALPKAAEDLARQIVGSVVECW